MTDWDEDTTEEHEWRITRCRRCRTQIIFLDHPRLEGKVRVEADTVRPEDTEYDENEHTQHRC